MKVYFLCHSFAVTDMKVVLVAIFVCSSMLGESDAQTIQASGNLTNNGKIAVNYRPTFSVSFPSDQYTLCSWKKNSNSQIDFFAFGGGCLPFGSTAPDNITCSEDTSTSPSTVFSTFSPPAPTTAPSNISMALICTVNFQTTFLVTSSYCGNISGGVNQNVSANQGFGSSHTFTCMTPAYTGPSQDAVCQSDATWNITGGVCSAVTTTPAATTTSAGATGYQGLTTVHIVLIVVFVPCVAAALGGGGYALWKYKPWQQYTGVPTK